MWRRDFFHFIQVFFPSKQLINLWFGDLLEYFWCLDLRGCFTKNGGAIEQRNGLDFLIFVSFFIPQILGGPKIEFTYNLVIFYHFIKVVTKIFKKLWGQGPPGPNVYMHMSCVLYILLSVLPSRVEIPSKKKKKNLL